VNSSDGASRWRRWLPSILAFAFVAWIIFLADAGYAIEFFAAIQSRGGDKLGHFVLIGGVAYFVNVSLGCRTWRRWLLGSLVIAALATVEELTQVWIDNRHCDALDLAADLAGIWLAGVLARRTHARRVAKAAEPEQ
jgi:hypothetical protein